MRVAELGETGRSQMARRCYLLAPFTTCSSVKGHKKQHQLIIFAVVPETYRFGNRFVQWREMKNKTHSPSEFCT